MHSIAARVLSAARRHLYSLELYKKVYLTARWRLSGSNEYRRRLEHMGSEEALLATASDASVLPQQQLTPFERMTDEQVRQVKCIYGMTPNPAVLAAVQRDAGFPAWLETVRAFQQLNREGRYRIVFFVNDVPPICPDGDVFYDGGSKALDAFYLRVLGDGTPAVSSYDEFLRVRPSQMPNATAHPIGNANAVKADVLFAFLRDRVLPSLAVVGHDAPPQS